VNPTAAKRRVVENVWQARSARSGCDARLYLDGCISAIASNSQVESALREEFERGGHEAGVVFIQSHATKGIIPCAPNKIALSTEERQQTMGA
jgi:hypothetical protein